MNRWTTRIALALTLLGGCSDPKSATSDDEGCEHLEIGPPAPLVAGMTADGAPAVAADHKRYDVELINIGGTTGGFLSFASAAAQDYLIYFSAAVPVQIFDGSGAAITPEESSTSSTTCTAIKGRHLVPLQVGTYTLKLGPTTVPSVSIVVEEAMHEAH